MTGLCAWELASTERGEFNGDFGEFVKALYGGAYSPLKLALSATQNSTFLVSGQWANGEITQQTVE
jgi:hypothetical protein